MKTLKEIFHIEAPVALAELTYMGESLTKFPWSKNSFDFSPYCVFEYKNGLLHYFYDQDGIDWKKAESNVADRDLVKDSVLLNFEKIRAVLLSEVALQKNELSTFIKKVQEFWIWFDCLWWMIEYGDKHGLNLEDLMRVRKSIEYFIPAVKSIIRKSISLAVPKLTKFVDVIFLKELFDDKIPDEIELKKRLIFCAYANEKIYSSEEDLSRDLNIILEHEKHDTEKEELSGQTAYSGRVCGVVKIVRSVKDIKDFKSGEIIVSSTTTPDFLPAMKKSAAIISEHGGIICHAAITSRELKIPCVVGVRGATSVLKNGYLVEVDADKGIVRILKK